MLRPVMSLVVGSFFSSVVVINAHASSSSTVQGLGRRIAGSGCDVDPQLIN